ncbi:MAG: SCO family protein [Kiritimatiellae bacterium]|nr:SCO family protein [Kiritimatiellia bacterium]
MMLTCCMAIPHLYAQDVAQIQPNEYEEISFQQKLDSQVPLDLFFRDETGEKIQLQDYFKQDKPLILSLVYYECPMLCTLVLNGLVDCLKQVPFSVGKEFNVLTVSFNHEETHVLGNAKRNTYLADYNRTDAKQGWHFLVGEKEPIAALAKSVGFRYKYDPKTDEYAHRSGIIVLTPQGKVSKYFPGAQYEPKDVRLGLVEASDNKIGSLVDKIFLLCYHYDPSIGRYGLVISRVINIGCGITVFALGLSIFILFKRERTSRKWAQAQT